MAYGVILIVFGILLAVWLVYVVEKARQLPWLKMIIAIILIALAIGFGLHLIFIQLAL